MRNSQYVIGIIVLALIGLAANMVVATLHISDNTAIDTEVMENGTSQLINVTSRMQQYVGMYGRIWSEVRLNVTVGSGTLYNKSVDRGMIYFFKNGATPTGPFYGAANDSETNANFSLTGYYIVDNHFIHNDSVCNTTSVWHLNTTDEYAVGIFRDSAANYNYFICTDITPKTSTNGFDTSEGSVYFEAILPKTSSYLVYDIWVDGETLTYQPT